ncbi:MAG: hypothetical protein N2035_10360, partial [Chthoniobacterales bacterium]|nr:hypothetical protein [Chthoniobacterales bacterium]
HGLDPLPPPPNHLRQQLLSLSTQQLLQRLQQLDPSALQLLDTHNPQRLRRAIEIILTTGLPLAQTRSRWKSPPQRSYLAFYLHRPRHQLHQRIQSNVTTLLSSGAIEEVAALRNLPLAQTPQTAIGFREISLYLDNSLCLSQLHSQIVSKTTQYAKRQQTWFRAQKEYLPIPLDDSPESWLSALQLAENKISSFTDIQTQT